MARYLTDLTWTRISPPADVERPAPPSPTIEPLFVVRPSPLDPPRWLRALDRPGPIVLLFSILVAGVVLAMRLSLGG